MVRSISRMSLRANCSLPEHLCESSFALSRVHLSNRTALVFRCATFQGKWRHSCERVVEHDHLDLQSLWIILIMFVFAAGTSIQVVHVAVGRKKAIFHILVREESRDELPLLMAAMQTRWNCHVDCEKEPRSPLAPANLHSTMIHESDGRELDECAGDPVDRVPRQHKCSSSSWSSSTPIVKLEMATRPVRHSVFAP